MKTMLWEYNFKRERKELEKIQSTHVWSKRKKISIFLLHLVSSFGLISFYFQVRIDKKPLQDFIWSQKNNWWNLNWFCSSMVQHFLSPLHVLIFPSFSQMWNSILIVSCVWSWNLLHSYSLRGIWIMWYINNKHVSYLRKAIKNQYMERGQKMLYYWGATSIGIPSIACLKRNEILKWFLDLENVCPYLAIEQKNLSLWND